jgi:hypothetical protein
MTPKWSAECPPRSSVSTLFTLLQGRTIWNIFDVPLVHSQLCSTIPFFTANSFHWASSFVHGTLVGKYFHFGLHLVTVQWLCSEIQLEMGLILCWVFLSADVYIYTQSFTQSVRPVLLGYLMFCLGLSFGFWSSQTPLLWVLPGVFCHHQFLMPVHKLSLYQLVDSVESAELNSASTVSGLSVAQNSYFTVLLHSNEFI